MILFHGTSVAFDTIDLSKTRRYKDFGRGFYATQLEDQARQWAVAMKERSASQNALVQCYEFEESKLAESRFLRFDEPSIEWAYFVMNNRNPRFTDFQNPLNNHLNQYDIVEGPVANDRIAVILDQFLVDLISGNALADALRYRELNHQISFHTSAAIGFLEKIDERPVR
jgi:hypothetical protein